MNAQELHELVRDIVVECFPDDADTYAATGASIVQSALENKGRLSNLESIEELHGLGCGVEITIPFIGVVISLVKLMMDWEEHQEKKRAKLFDTAALAEQLRKRLVSEGVEPDKAYKISRSFAKRLHSML